MYIKYKPNANKDITKIKDKIEEYFLLTENLACEYFKSPIFKLLEDDFDKIGEIGLLIVSKDFFNVATNKNFVIDFDLLKGQLLQCNNLEDCYNVLKSEIQQANELIDKQQNKQNNNLNNQF